MCLVNATAPGQIDRQFGRRHFQIYYENDRIPIEMSLRFVFRMHVDNKPTLVEIMLSRRQAVTWFNDDSVHWRTWMTSSNGNIFRVTGHFCGEFTGPGEFPTQRPVTRSFDVFFALRLNKRLSKQTWGWWFETPSWALWRQCNAYAGQGGYVPCWLSLLDHNLQGWFAG